MQEILCGKPHAGPLCVLYGTLDWFDCVDATEIVMVHAVLWVFVNLIPLGEFPVSSLIRLASLERTTETLNNLKHL